MKVLVYTLLLLGSLTVARAQKDTLYLRTGKTTSFTIVPGSYGTRGKILTGSTGTYNTGLAKTPQLGSDSTLVIFQAISNKFEINSLVTITNISNHRVIIAAIKDGLGKGAAKKGDLVELEKEGLKALGTTQKSLKIKVQSFVLSDSLSKLYLHTDTQLVTDTTKAAADTAANTFTIIGKPVKGIASFYSANLEGTKTSTGEIFRHRQLTAASNNFKLNTWVLVTNLKNQKSVIVRINDHMHPRMKKKGRVVDLTRAAAALLDFMQDGLAKVEVVPVKFIHAPLQQSEEDSLKAIVRNDSLAIEDSAKLDSVKVADENTVEGIASFYSTNLDGTKTATGETFRNAKLSAASNNFPLNSWVRITNLKNNKTVVLRINDRMHPRMKKKGRVVDLSRAAAKKLDFIKSGVTRVKVEIVSKDTVD